MTGRKSDPKPDKQNSRLVERASLNCNTSNAQTCLVYTPVPFLLTTRGFDLKTRYTTYVVGNGQPKYQSPIQEPVYTSFFLSVTSCRPSIVLFISLTALTSQLHHQQTPPHHPEKLSTRNNQPNTIQPNKYAYKYIHSSLLVPSINAVP